MQIIVPKRHVLLSDAATPHFFLGGPVRGGGDWQIPMTLGLHEAIRGDFTVAVPCRWDETHSLAKYFAPDDGIRHFPRQLDWEQHYLAVAGTAPRIGCVIFWLGCESMEAPHPGPEPYAMDTRGEIAEWRMRMKFENARVVVGAEAGFHGLSQIQRNFSHVLGYDFPIYDTIEKTIAAAVARAYA